jgi:hypothetical protein
MFHRSLSKSSWSTRSPFTRPTPKLTTLPISLHDVSDAWTNGRCGHVEAHGHVAASDVETHAADADVVGVADNAADRVGVAQMAVGAEHTCRRVIERHAGRIWARVFSSCSP